jgi:Uma2 family endonuclease
MVVPDYCTAAMVRELPDDGQRYEVVDGELLVTPAPRHWHQVIVVRLLRTIADYLDCERVGHVIVSPADISWTPYDLVQPDVFVVPLVEARTLDWGRMRRLLLVAEVLSPSTARSDRFTKRRRYQQAGVPLYWVIDPEGESAEVWTPADQAPRVEHEWRPAEAGASLRIRLKDLFRPI